jgi:hypothetical protein
MDNTENYASNISSIIACVLVAAVTFLPSLCLGTIMGHTRGGIYEGLRLNGLRCHDIHAKRHKNWLKHLKVDEIHRQQGKSISLLLFSQSKKSRLKINVFFVFKYI